MKEQSAAGILETTIEKVKNLVNVSTIIGEPMNIDGGITIIPVSKVTYGFASGGSDFPPRQIRDFGGGGERRYHNSRCFPRYFRRRGYN